MANEARAECIRDIFTTKSTTSVYTLYGETGLILFKGYKLEDVARPLGVKIQKETCIPEGDYWLSINDSVRFQRKMPIIYNTLDLAVVDSHGKRWDGIREHWGNFSVDTDGCPIIGTFRDIDIVNCKPFASKAFFEDTYFPLLNDLVNKFGRIPYKIINQQS